jgi:hypothetical protein
MRNHLSLLLIVLLLSCKTTPPYDAISSLKRDIGLLASDSLAGREVGTEGERMAADYLRNRMKEVGLVPKGTEGYFQKFFVKKSTNPHEEAKISTEGGEDGITGYNVIGMLDNPSDNVVIIGAHYDHLGMGGMSSMSRGVEEVHNGADDNASGTAALLHLAQKLKDMELQTDILFIAVSGEEQGLWGSNFYTKNPTVDLSKVNFMINMDMVGRLENDRGLAVYGTGTAPDWDSLIDEVNTDSLKIIKKESGKGPSDHTSFYLKDIPVLHFFTGQHVDYHRPSDDADKINFEGIVQVTNMIERIVVALDAGEKLIFQSTKDEESNTPRFTVSLGVMPDYLYDGKGLLVADVSADKPAIKAGLLKGDVVVQLGDSTVTDMMSYMRALSIFKKGDKTNVVVERDGARKEFEVEF